MSENYNDSVHHGYEEEVRVNLMPPASLTTPLWKSLFAQAKERISPERLPPIQITSHPVDVGMLVGESVSLPWYRTIFVNLGNVIAPETLPPLELESHPVDIGVLISDQMGVPWYSSRSLR